MKPPPNMPQFGGRVPPTGQQQQQQQHQMQAQLQAAIGQVSLGIYSQLSAAYVRDLDDHESLNKDKLRELAKNAQTAALCYFEGIGAISQKAEEGQE